MTRFEDIDDSVVEVYMNVIEKRFPFLGQLNIKLIFDLKKRVKEGKICLASIELANEKIKYFSKDDVAVEGYDVVVFLDKKAWELANEKDRIRLMSHELRHVFIDENGKVKLLPHDISDFREEIKLNQDDPEWDYRLTTVLNDIYEQEKEMAKAKNKGQYNG
jgi:hypothetical protein